MCKSMQDNAVQAVEIPPPHPPTTPNYTVRRISQPQLFTSVDVGFCRLHSPNKRSTTLKMHRVVIDALHERCRGTVK